MVVELPFSAHKIQRIKAMLRDFQSAHLLTTQFVYKPMKKCLFVKNLARQCTNIKFHCAVYSSSGRCLSTNITFYTFMSLNIDSIFFWILSDDEKAILRIKYCIPGIYEALSPSFLKGTTSSIVFICRIIVLMAITNSRHISPRSLVEFFYLKRNQKRKMRYLQSILIYRMYSL